MTLTSCLATTATAAAVTVRVLGAVLSNIVDHRTHIIVALLHREQFPTLPGHIIVELRHREPLPLLEMYVDVFVL